MMFRYSFARADVARPHRARGAQGAAAGLSHRRHRAAGREGHRHARDGRRRGRGAAERMMATRRPRSRVRRAEVARRRGAAARRSRRRRRWPARCSCRCRASRCGASASRISRPDDYMLVAEVKGEVVGNLGLHLASKSPRRRHAGYIGMAVRDDWHGRGVGSALHGRDRRHRRQLARLPASRAHGVHRQRGRARAVPQVRLRDRGHAARVRVSRRRATSTPTRWRGCAPRRGTKRDRGAKLTKTAAKAHREPHPANFVLRVTTI